MRQPWISNRVAATARRAGAGRATPVDCEELVRVVPVHAGQLCGALLAHNIHARYRLGRIRRDGPTSRVANRVVPPPLRGGLGETEIGRIVGAPVATSRRRVLVG